MLGCLLHVTSHRIMSSIRFTQRSHGNCSRNFTLYSHMFESSHPVILATLASKAVSWDYKCLNTFNDPVFVNKWQRIDQRFAAWFISHLYLYGTNCCALRYSRDESTVNCQNVWPVVTRASLRLWQGRKFSIFFLTYLCFMTAGVVFPGKK